MSKNTNISELINYISYDGSGNVVFTTVSAAASNTDKFLVSDAGVLKFRTAAQLLSDIGAQASGSYQAALSGTGFVKISGTTISYDNSTYATQTYVGTAISNLVDSSPATLDTLNELAAALGDDPNFATTVATSIGTKQPQLNGTGFVKVTGTTVSYDNATYLTTGTAGTTYIPYTGATGNVNLGVYDLDGGNVNINGSGSGGGALRLKQFVSSEGNREGYNSISTLTSGVFYFTSSASVPNFKNFALNPSGLTDNTLRTYTLPDASGTLALTSDIPSVSGVYLPLAGGTLTGQLNGTSAVFSGAVSGTSGSFNGNVRAVDTYNLYKSGNATLGGQLSYDSVINQLYLWNNISNGFFSIYTNSTERLNIGSDGTSTFKGPGIVVNRPTASSGEPFVAFSKDGVSRGSIYGADGTAGLRFFSEMSTFIGSAAVVGEITSTSHATFGSSSSSANLRLYSNGANFQIWGSTGYNRGFFQTTWDVSPDRAVLAANEFRFNTGATIGTNLGSPALTLASSGAATFSTIIDGTIIRLSSTQPLSFTGGGNTGTFTQSAIYSSQNNVSGNEANGIFIERGRITDSGSGEIRHLVIGARGGQVQWKLSGTGGSTQYDTAEVKPSGDADYFVGRFSGGSAKCFVAYQSGNDGYLELRTGANATVTKLSGYAGTPAYMNTKLTVGGTGSYTSSTLAVEGGLKVGRSIYGWFQSGTNSWDGFTYLHLKTNISAGLGGNIHYTMSLFYARLYSYTGQIKEGHIGFHNWDGAFFAPATTGNIWAGPYRSSDGFIVLVLTISSSSHVGVTVDWHQAFPYPFVDKVVTAYSGSNSTSGVY